MGTALEQLILPLFDAIGLGHKPTTKVQTNGVKLREIMLPSQQPIQFTLKRGKRRTIGFVINDDGLTVSVPTWLSLSEIDKAVAEKSVWIERKLVEWREHQKRRNAAQIVWQSGQTIHLLGKPLQLSVDANYVGTQRIDDILCISLPQTASEERIRSAAQAWLQAQAKMVFAQRIEHICALGAKRPKRWSLSSARTRWGSCNSDGTVRLNWRLIHFRLDVIDYVVAHELAHLSEMNHSKKFWRTVESLFPEYEKARAELANYTDDFVIN
jgi:predicted metal-dependent hydrolase